MHIFYKIMFFVSIALVLLALSAAVFWGLRLGTDFKGGSILEVSFLGKSLPEVSQIRDLIKKEETIRELSISPAGEDSFIIRTNEISESVHQEILAEMNASFGAIEEKRFSSVGAVIGKELKQKSIVAVILVLVLITIYIAFVFRKLSRVLSPFAMSLAAIVALVHDVAVPIGVFAFLGYYYGIEITAVFVAAVLTILGYSVSDTVVVFDRVRENILKFGTAEKFSSLVHRSIIQTLTRSLNTTFTTLLSLFAIYFFGGESVKYFSLAMIMGIFLGAYSSIFVASPLLVWLSRTKNT